MKKPEEFNAHVVAYWRRHYSLLQDAHVVAYRSRQRQLMVMTDLEAGITDEYHYD